MKRLLLIVCLAPLMMANTCNEQGGGEAGELDDNYVVLGHYYGFCHGEQCVEIFKITREQIYEDLNDDYPNGLYNAQWKPIEKEIAMSPTAIREMIPDTLFHQTNQIFGMPDAYDQGGQYLEVEYKGERVYWYLDQDTSNIPPYLVPLHDKINEVVRKLE